MTRSNAVEVAKRVPVVAVVGRPNVGKSTLVNRIIGRREAIVEERPGVTRDRKVVDAEWIGRDFQVVDTGGWLAGEDGLDAKVSRQAEKAIADSDLVLLVVDVTVGITEEDDRVATLLRRGNRPVLVVANKADSDRRELEAWEFARLGLGDPIPVSALHGRGTGELLDEVVARLPSRSAISSGLSPALDDGGGDGEILEADTIDEDEGDKRADDGTMGVAIVGRPNVGKSTLFNRLIGDERSIVHDMPGTTRDTVDTVVETSEGEIRFLDTAGMRRKSRVDDGAEFYSLVRALQAIDEADASLLLIDATEGVTHQDQRLAERIDAAGSPIVVVLNKWELLSSEQRMDVTAQVADRLSFLSYAPVLKTSARTGLGVHKILPALGEALEAYHRRVPTGELNKVVQAAQASHPPTGGRVLYATQGATDPPTFTLFASRRLPPTYLRYLERMIREHFGFGPTPLKIRVRLRAK